MEAENRKPNIQIRDLNVTYNQGKSNEMRALENVNLEIYPEEYVIIFGPSGCGKSTLLYSIAGLEKPTGGTVEIDNQNINQFSKKESAEFHRNKIGMVFQAFHLINSLTVIDNVCIPKVFNGEDVGPRREMAVKLLERFSIEAQADKLPNELSGGQKQRVSIARSLINNPEIILADEPVGNLDSKSSYNVMMILKELNEKDKKTIILVTHDPSHLEYGDRVIHMKDGKVIKIEVVRSKKAPELKDTFREGDSFIFKDGKLNEELKKGGLVREEFVPADLRMLMKSFKGLSLSQLGVLLTPFKSGQLFSHVFFTMTDEQIESAKKKLQEYLGARLSFEDFLDELDRDIEKGGAGWDKRTAKNFASSVKRILGEVDRIDFSKAEESSLDLTKYMTSLFDLKLGKTREVKFAQMILDRLKNRVGIVEFQKILDLPEKKGGLGLDKRISGKVSRELEIILLLRYSASSYESS